MGLGLVLLRILRVISAKRARHLRKLDVPSRTIGSPAARNGELQAERWSNPARAQSDCARGTVVENLSNTRTRHRPGRHQKNDNLNKTKEM